MLDIIAIMIFINSRNLSRFINAITRMREEYGSLAGSDHKGLAPDWLMPIDMDQIIGSHHLTSSPGVKAWPNIIKWTRHERD